MHMRTASVLLLAHVVLSTLVDIAGVDRPVLFSKLYRKALSLRSRRSIFSPSARKIDAERARVYVGKYVSALNGVEMGICVPSERDGDCMDAGRYDAMYGEGAAESVVAMARTFSRKRERHCARHRCSGCSERRCTEVYDSVIVNRFPCAHKVCCVSCSAAGAGAGYLVCGAFGAFSTLFCCSVCGFIISTACNNCYYKERRIIEIVEANAPDACASHTK